MPSSTRPLKILLTEGSSTSARQTLYALGPRHTIDVLDPSAFCQCRFSSLARRWYRCPSYSREPEEYLRFLGKRLASEPYDVVFPTHEQVYLLSRVKEELSELAAVALPDFDALRRVQGKADFARLLDELELPGPSTSIVSNRADLEQWRSFPCFVKLSHSTAGTGVFPVADAGEMADLLTRLEEEGHLPSRAAADLDESQKTAADAKTPTEILVQEPARGTLSVFQSIFQHGRLVASHGAEARVLGVGGAPMARVSGTHDGVREAVEKLGAALNWHGAFFVEYFHDSESGRFQLLEANPRIGETLNATLCGVNLCEQWLRVALGEEVTPLHEFETGVRTHQHFMMIVNHAQRGMSRAALVGEMWKAFRRRGMYSNSEDELTRPRADWLSLAPAIAVKLQMLLRPSAAKSLVTKTVKNYSLPEAAAHAIEQMPHEKLVSCLRGES